MWLGIWSGDVGCASCLVVPFPVVSSLYGKLIGFRAESGVQRTQIPVGGGGSIELS